MITVPPIRVCWPLGLLMSMAGFVLVSRALFAQEDLSLRPDDSSSLRWRASKARQAGKTSISSPHLEVAQPENLDDALEHTTLVLAKFLGRATSHNDDLIVTWRKYRVLEKFSSQPYVWQESDEPLAQFIPPSLLPIAADEFATAEIGGSAVVDGVDITMRSSENRPLPETKPLLMLLQFAASGSIAALNYGSIGAYWIDQSQSIRAIDDSAANPLGAELLNRSAGTLTALRTLTHFRTDPRR